jgi:outer membrane lipoprotein-sorting protein
MGNTVFMTGSFAQTDYWALTLEEETSSGTMYIAQPDLFLLSYSEPEGSGTGYDGSVFYTLEPDLQQVLLYPSREPGSFLHLIEKCADSTVTETVQCCGDSISVELEGDFGDGINHMEVGFTLSDSLPFLFSTTDYNGNRTVYEMWDVTTADLYPENAFQLVVPNGYTVVNPEEM